MWRQLALAPLILACGAYYNPGLRKDLEKRAEFDLRCAAAELQFVELSTMNGAVTSYGVTGCGQQATYVLNTHSLTWVLNSDAAGAPAPATSAAAPPPVKPKASVSVPSQTSSPPSTSGSSGYWK